MRGPWPGKGRGGFYRGAFACCTPYGSSQSKAVRNTRQASTDLTSLEDPPKVLYPSPLVAFSVASANPFHAGSYCNLAERAS